MSKTNYEVIDSHCHLDFKNFKKDRDEVVQRARSAGVVKMINSGVDLVTNERTLEFTRNYDFIYPTLGLNPNSLDKMGDEDVQATLDQIRYHADEIIGVGEAGLDYHWCTDLAGRERQINVFRNVIRLAEDLDLPLVIHAREAEQECLDMVRDLNKVIFHCYSGTVATMKSALDSGFYISLATIVCRSAHHQELAEQVPLDHLLIETDSPFLSPRKGRNEPSYILDSLALIAKIKNVSPAEIAQVTTKNVRKIYNL
ncbi:MAG: TatD family hydrolase [Methanotrichaceae archaeon]